MNHGYEASLVKRVVNQLVAGIVSGEYQDNVLPPQVILSKKHGVSRTIMREALSILISRRMLDVRPKTGTRIKPAREWLIMDPEVAEWRMRALHDPECFRRLIEFRSLVDPPAAALAATRANRHQRIAINAAYQRLVHASPSEPLQSAAEEALQAAIVDASGDELLCQMGSVVRVGIRTLKAALRSQPHPLPRVPESQLGDYGRLVRAIETADGDGARNAMSQVLTRTASLWVEEIA
ncbi:GntR family transcriptional regulator [Burkholderia sp. THE68]|jgi:DNA-binding FadR family transcriptional regulator|uniref:FadR/GntR family transcriptional regulator n=1 Tax=Burkholderiaceae TaxID=119060 RepID=UPI001315B214|nr:MULTISPECIES: FCD domain-containing protein [Burkholderiaceae]BBU29630.1 GntR family transcriptional regulator [Burkholderia sp. THE68]BCQ25474.1 FCD domain-containing protein [Caballeronia sp. NK8]